VDAQPGSGRGKLLSEQWAEIFGRLTAYGMSPLDIIQADSVERQALLEIGPYVIKAGIERDQVLANRIIWELSEAMKNPRKSAAPNG
jgi:hypothetical protein